MTLQLTQPLPPAPHEIVSLEVGLGKTVVYRIVNGTAYHESTGLDVVALLEQLRHDRTRVRFFFGDVLTGRDWCEENDTIGHIGRSSGRIKIPLLIKTSRSSGGGGLSDNAIVRMTVNGHEIYRHKNYYVPTMQLRVIDPEDYVGDVNLREAGYVVGVYRATLTGADPFENVANFKSREAAERWIEFIEGKRDGK